MVRKLRTRRNEVRKGKLRGKQKQRLAKGWGEPRAGKTIRICRGGAKV